AVDLRGTEDRPGVDPHDRVEIEPLRGAGNADRQVRVGDAHETGPAEPDGREIERVPAVPRDTSGRCRIEDERIVRHRPVADEGWGDPHETDEPAQER